MFKDDKMLNEFLPVEFLYYLEYYKPGTTLYKIANRTEVESPSKWRVNKFWIDYRTGDLRFRVANQYRINKKLMTRYVSLSYLEMKKVFYHKKEPFNLEYEINKLNEKS